LTAQQGNPGDRCHGVKVYKSIEDPAFGGGHLTLSDAALRLNQTFCKSCHMGIIAEMPSSGNMSKMHAEVIMYLNKGKTHDLTVENKWHEFKTSAQENVTAPLVMNVKAAYKHRAALDIKNWYSSKKHIEILARNVYVFDDEKKSVELFNWRNGGINARQVSCHSRDTSHQGLVGRCGATTAEIKKDDGIHYCTKMQSSSAVIV